MLSSSKIQHLVIDSGGFIKGHDFSELGTNLYSLVEVIEEIKDRETKRRISSLPYAISLKTPTVDSIREVSDVAKETGDFGNLSATDIKVLAVTLDIYKEVGFSATSEEDDNVDSNELENVENLNLGSENFPGFYMPDDCEYSSPEHNLVIDGEDNLQSPNEENLGTILAEEKIRNELSIGCPEENCDVGWITPCNIRKIGQYSTLNKIKHSMKVACMTTDYSMQNILKKLKIDAVNPQGYLIQTVRTYILRCIACFKTTTDVTKQFCPKCGNKTMKRVSVSYDEEGHMRMYLSKKPLNLRGTKFSLPMPKGGKHAVNPILVEDQKIPHQRPSRKSLQKIDILGPDYVSGSSPFIVHDIYSRAANLGNCGSQHRAYWERRNPNEKKNKK